MMFMDEEKDHAKEAEGKESEESEQQPGEGKQHNVQESAQVPITLATPIRDSRSRPHLRLLFATPDRAPNRDSLFLS